MAGLVVDTALYPVDTIKSRLQSKQGFSRAGGFSKLYRGLPPVLAGSVPNGK
jgi:solute carrier family 25 S-adenosylmethionine transporter 26